MSTPHKCPVCEGTGKVVDALRRERIDCRACSGSGVVWEGQGPRESAEREGDPRELTGL